MLGIGRAVRRIQGSPTRAGTYRYGMCMLDSRYRRLIFLSVLFVLFWTTFNPLPTIASTPTSTTVAAQTPLRPSHQPLATNGAFTPTNFCSNFPRLHRMRKFAIPPMGLPHRRKMAALWTLNLHRHFCGHTSNCLPTKRWITSIGD